MSEEPDTKRTKTEQQPPQKKYKIKKKIYPSIAQFPTVDFHSLLEAEREKIERDSNAILSMRGKGSGYQNDDEGRDPLHVLIEAESEDQGHKAERMVREVLNDPNKLPPPVQTQLAVRQSIFGNKPRYGDSKSSTVSSGGDFMKEVRVDEVIAGAIIGKAGETIKRLQSETGARIHVSRDPSLSDEKLRVITIRASSQEVAENAEAAILDFIKNRNSNPSRGDNNDGLITVHYPIPHTRAGAVIGRQGATIKALQAKYNAKVSVPPEQNRSSPTRILVICADSEETIEAIKKEVDDIVEGKASFASGASGGVSIGGFGELSDGGTPVKIPDDKAGLIIGRQGVTIKAIQEKLGVRIQIPQQADPGSIPPCRTASVIGKPEMVVLAIREIENILNGELINPSASTSSLYNSGGTLSSSSNQSAQAAAAGSQDTAAYAAQWEEYYRQLALLPPEQQKIALEALAQQQQQYYPQ